MTLAKYVIEPEKCYGIAFSLEVGKPCVTLNSSRRQQGAGGSEMCARNIVEKEAQASPSAIRKLYELKVV